MQKKVFLIVMMVLAMGWNAMAADGKFTLVIDPGHGGRDAGAPGKISVEKDINLKVALAFGKYVESNCSDVRVIYTRKTDVFVELSERANIANRNKADLFISIHTNALDGGKISRGFETYTLGMHRAADNLNVAKRENSVILIEKNYKQRYAGFDPKSAESYIMFELMQDKNMANSVELAKMIQSEVCSVSGRVNKGVHQAGFLVLRETSMPSCLVELGFITTSDEEQFLNTADGQNKMARGIYQAFLKYKKKYGNTKLRAQGEERAMVDDERMLAQIDSETETTQPDEMDRKQSDLKQGADMLRNGMIADEQNVDETEYSEQRAVRPADAFVSSVSEANEVMLLLTATASDGREMALSPPKSTDEAPPQQPTNPTTPQPLKKQDDRAELTAPKTTTDNKTTETAPQARPENKTTDATTSAKPEVTPTNAQKPSTTTTTSTTPTPQSDTPTPQSDTPTPQSDTTTPQKAMPTTQTAAPTTQTAPPTTQTTTPTMPTHEQKTPEVEKKVVLPQQVEDNMPPQVPIVVARNLAAIWAVTAKQNTTAKQTGLGQEGKDTASVTKNTVQPTNDDKTLAHNIIPAKVEEKAAKAEVKPSTPKETPQPSTPKETPKPVTPKETPKPATPKETPKPATPKETPKPSTPKETPKPSTPKIEAKPLPKSDAIIFKVQIAASSKQIPTDNEIFQGVKGIETYTDNGMVKYTVGASQDFDEIGKLKKDLATTFPQAFIVAFKNGTRMDIAQAMREYRNNKKNQTKK